MNHLHVDIQAEITDLTGLQSPNNGSRVDQRATAGIDPTRLNRPRSV